MCITLKDYKVKTGVATRICSHDLSTPTKSTYKITGPLGKGLNVKPSGVHIAFSAGTGALVYIDLVAYLIRENLGLNSESKKIDKNFKFVFFVSYASLHDAIGRDLCLGLQQIC